MAREELDITAVQRDAQTVQALASRARSLLDENDPIAHHLAAWVAEIDRGIDESVVVRLPERQTPPQAQSGPSRRRAIGVAGATVMALVVSSGAAAAVTGDPLAAVRDPLSVIKSINPFAGDSPSEKPSPTVAEANQLLADAQRAIARGDLERAALLLEQAAGSTDQQARIERLTDRLAEASKDPQSKGPVDKDPVDKDPMGGKAVDKDPVDKDPVDKDPQSKGPVGEDPVERDPQGGQAVDQGSEADAGKKPKPDKGAERGTSGDDADQGGRSDDPGTSSRRDQDAQPDKGGPSAD